MSDHSTHISSVSKSFVFLAFFTLAIFFNVDSYGQDKPQDNEQCQTYNIPEIIAELGRLLGETRDDVEAFDRYNDFLEFLPEEVQKEIKALEDAKNIAETPWPDIDEELFVEVGYSGYDRSLSYSSSVTGYSWS